MTVSRTMTLLAVLAVSISYFASEAKAQRGRGDRAEDLLRNESVQKELDITEEQKKKLDEARRSAWSGAREKWTKLREELKDLPEDKRREKYREAFTKMRKEGEDKVNKILLPHQRNRLKQIQVQRQIQRRGTNAALTSSAVAEELGITDEQKKKLAEKSAEVQKELAEKYKKLIEEARKDILSVLTPEQRKKLNKLRGEKFEYKSNPRRSRQRGGESNSDA